jgi:hypothetical protein
VKKKAKEGEENKKERGTRSRRGGEKGILE